MNQFENEELEKELQEVVLRHALLNLEDNENINGNEIFKVHENNDKNKCCDDFEDIDTYSQNLDKRIKKHKVKQKMKKYFKTSRNIAACLVVVISLAFVSRYAFGFDVGASADDEKFNYLEWTPVYVKFDRTGTLTSGVGFNYYMSCIPERFKFESAQVDSGGMSFKYYNKDNLKEYLIFNHHYSDGTVYMDNERCTINKIKIGDNYVLVAEFFTEKFTIFNWMANGESFSLKGAVDFYEMVKIYEGIAKA